MDQRSMEVIHGKKKNKASTFAAEDFISSMPDNVITNIMDRLPLPDAVRTDILSKNWRFKWTMLSQLAFDEKFFACLSKTVCDDNHLRIITRLLLHLKGAITKCIISLESTSYHGLDVEDINHWILFLSRKGIKDVTFGKRFASYSPLKSPAHLFSCLELKSLKLFNCCFYFPTSCHGFPNLLCLELLSVQFESRQFGEFIARCPELEILKVSAHCNARSNAPCKVKLDDIAKLANLKTLSLFLCNLENMTTISSATIFKLLGFLPKLQELDLDFRDCKLTEDGAEKKFPAAFPCLKALKLSNIDLGSGIMLSCVFEVIRHLPNMQTLEITACDHKACLETCNLFSRCRLQYNGAVAASKCGVYRFCMFR